MISPERKTIEEILQKNTIYAVPEYQRDFEWKRENAEDFWQDLETGDFFLGTFVFDVSNKDKVEVVDGQQRLTTIFILLSAIRERAKSNKSIAQAHSVHDMIVSRNMRTGKQGSTKFIASEKIREVYNSTVANDNWDGKDFNFKNKKRQSNRIRPLYAFFSEKIKHYDESSLSDLLDKLYESFAIVIQIEKTEEAFDIFERMNARGVELNAADLLKNYLFSRIDNDNLKVDWDLIVEQAYGNIIRMIKYFYVSKFGYVSKKDLFKKLKSYGESIGPLNLYNELRVFSQHYGLIVGGSKDNVIEWATQYDLKELLKEYNAQRLNSIFDGINLFGVTQSYPLFVKVMDLLSRITDRKLRDSSSKHFINFAESIENFHFLNNAIAQKPGNQVEKYYADVCEREVQPHELTDFMKSVVTHLRDEKVVDLDEFCKAFVGLSYESDFKLIYYINDRLNNNRLEKTTPVFMYNPDKRLLRRNYNIEHLISQETSAYNFEIDVDVIHNIGNLIVLGLQLNSKLQNKSIIEKLDILNKNKNNLPEIVQLCEDWSNKKWDSAESLQLNISERALRLAERAYKTVWKLAA